MVADVTIRKVGNSLGVTLSEIAREMGLKEGDKLNVVRTERGFELTPFDPDFADALEAARASMKDNADALRELAK